MRQGNDNYFTAIPVPNIPKVRLPFTEDTFYTDSISALALDVTEVVATIKQANTIEVEYMTDSLIKGMVGVTHTPAGQSLGLSGTAWLPSPQHRELMETLVAAARHQPIVRRKLPSIVENYTVIPKGQQLAWQTEHGMEHQKLQCQTEMFMEPQYQALRVNATDGFRGAASYCKKFSTLYQVTANGVTRRGCDTDGVVTAALGLPNSADKFTPVDQRTSVPAWEEGMPYRLPDMMARRMLRNNTMTINRLGPVGQGAYNSGGPSNLLSVNGASPMVIARAGPHYSREVVLAGSVGDFTVGTTVATIEEEKETVSVEPQSLEDPAELVSTMQRSLRLKPLTVTIEFRKLLRPFKFKAHLDRPQIVYTQGRTADFPFDTRKLNLLVSPNQ